jgi:hypothetical protein
MPNDRVQREIEELLDQLDTFVPEERFTTKMKERKRKRAAAERTGPTLGERLRAPFKRITLGHVLIGGLILFAVSYLFDDALGDWAMWVTLAGLVLAGGAFVLSVINGGQMRTGGAKGRVQRRWRGEIIEYGEPSTMDRVRGWFRRGK